MQTPLFNITETTLLKNTTFGERVKLLSLQHGDRPILFIGSSSRLLEAQHQLRQFAQSTEPVLITGESGVGKELFARSIYLLSNRVGKAFVSVNCGQFHDEEMMVSELFGHTKGSFTGAVDSHIGVFEMGHRGIVFLDEVGELTLNAQKMLLRVLDQNEIKPLGSQTIKQVDIRIVSATHCDLEKMVFEGRFRKDLYYRLSTLHLNIPPLRERNGDCEQLVHHFLSSLNKEHGIEKYFSNEAMEFLKNYSFPGNVRELKSIVETGFWGSQGAVIHFKDISNKTKGANNITSDASTLYANLAADGNSFWNAVRKPFLERELNRGQVKAIIRQGLEQAGNYKNLLKILNIAESDYKKFMNFVQEHRLKP